VMLNVVLTLINKAVFYYGQFTFPVTLSAIHMLVSSFFTLIIVRWLKWFPRAKLDRDGDRTMFLFSSLFCSNIVFGNFSLQYGSISLVQVIRATIPGITMILSMIVLGKKYSKILMLTVIPICVGMMLTVKGEVKLNFLGLVFSLIGSFLSALKVVLCNKFLVGSWSLHPLDLLDRSTFFAFLQLTFFIYYLGESEAILSNFHQFGNPFVLFLVFGSAIIAFLLNVTNFFTNQTTSPLILSVSGNVKQCVSILVGIVLFNEDIHLTNATGIMITMLGTIWFSYVRLQENLPSKERGPTGSTGSSGMSSSSGHGHGHTHSQTSNTGGVSSTVSGERVSSAVALDNSKEIIISINSEPSKSNK